MSNYFRVIRRHFVIHNLSAERHLHPVEPELRCQRDRVRVGAHVQVPVSHTNAKLPAFSESHTGTEAESYCGRQKVAAGQFEHQEPPEQRNCGQGGTRARSSVTPSSPPSEFTLP